MRGPHLIAGVAPQALLLLFYKGTLCHWGTSNDWVTTKAKQMKVVIWVCELPLQAAAMKTTLSRSTSLPLTSYMACIPKSYPVNILSCNGRPKNQNGISQPCSTSTFGGAADLVGSKAFIAACWRLSTTVGIQHIMSKNAQASCKSCTSEANLSWSQCGEVQSKLQVTSILNLKASGFATCAGASCKDSRFFFSSSCFNSQWPARGRDTKTQPRPWHLQAASWSS